MCIHFKSWWEETFAVVETFLYTPETQNSGGFLAGAWLVVGAVTVIIQNPKGHANEDFH